MTAYFGENLKKLRKSKELTQETLADFLGVSIVKDTTPKPTL